MKKYGVVIVVCIILVTAGFLWFYLGDSGLGTDPTAEEVITTTTEEMNNVNSYEVRKNASITKIQDDDEIESQQKITMESDAVYNEEQNAYKHQGAVSNDVTTEFGVYYAKDTLYEGVREGGVFNWNKTETSKPVKLFNNEMLTTEFADTYRVSYNEENSEYVLTTEKQKEKAWRILNTTVHKPAETIPNETIVDGGIQNYEAEDTKYEVRIDRETMRITTVTMNGTITPSDTDGRFETTATIEYVDTDAEVITIPSELEDTSAVGAEIDVDLANIVDMILRADDSLKISVTAEQDGVDSVHIDTKLETKMIENPEPGQYTELKPNEDYVTSNPDVEVVVEYETGATAIAATYGPEDDVV